MAAVSKGSVMRVDGIERPWWWMSGPLWQRAIAPVLATSNLVQWLYHQSSTYHLISWIGWSLLTLGTIACEVVTRRRLEWERREF